MLWHSKQRYLCHDSAWTWRSLVAGVVHLLVFLICFNFHAVLAQTTTSGLSSSHSQARTPVFQSAQPLDQETQIRIGVLAFRGQDVARAMWTPMVDYLSKTVPEHRFSLVPLTLDTIDLVTRQKQIDFILTNPANYVALEAKYGVTRIATLRNKRLGRPSTQFGAVIFTRADRHDLNTLEDLRGQRFMAVHPGAFGGWWMAWRELKEHGIQPSKDLTLQFSNSTHDAVVHAVLNREADAGTVRTDLLEHLALDKKINLSDVKILNMRSAGDFPFLLSTRLYPEWAISILKHVPDTLGHDVAVALLNIRPDGPVAAAASSAGWTVPKDYRAVDELMQVLKVGHHARFGEITLQAVLTQYRREFYLLLIVVLLLVIFSFHVAALNNRLKRSEHALRDQVLRRETAQAETQKHVVRLRKLYTISASMGSCLEEEINRLLRESCDLLSMNSGRINVFDVESGLISTPYFYFDDIALAVGGEEQRIVDSCESVAYVTNEPFVQHDLAAARSELAKGLNYPSSGAYISVPLWVSGAKYGTVSFYSKRALTEDFLSADEELVMLLSRWITVAIERNNAVQREKAEKVAQAANIAREGFIANMSHEMKTPLTAIVGHSEHLLHDIVSAADVDDLLSMILQNARQATHLINDVLDLSSIDHDELVVESCPIMLERFLHEVKDLCAPQAIDKHLKFEIRKKYPLPKIIHSDPILIKKTLLHLVNNAVKFTDRGYIEILVFYDVDSKSLNFDVTDSGIGIEKNQLTRIFEPFTQVNSGRNRSHGGTGLGLYLVKNYLEKLGGAVKVTSNVGRGSCFSISLPNIAGKTGIELVEAPTKAAARASAGDLSSHAQYGDGLEHNVQLDQTDQKNKKKYVGNVLLAEDNPVNQKIIQRHLENMGLTVKVVENGQQAVESCDISDFDLILMDIQMPVMDGVEAARQIIQNHSHPPPIVAITANSLKEDLQTYKSVGCVGHICKPIDGQSFREVIGGLLKTA